MLARRAFLIGGASAASAFAIGWTASPANAQVPPRKSSSSSDATGVQAALNGWLTIGSDNTVTIVMSKAEMGQGIHTGAAMLLADELGADWSQVRIADAPIDALYINQVNLARSLPLRPDDHSWFAKSEEEVARLLTRFFGTLVTGGSTSISDLWEPMREAGAAARIMLCSAAAKLWNAPVSECEARAGRVVWGSKKSATFGELADKAKLEHAPSHVTLKDTSKFTLIGKRLNRIEALSKTDGTAQFGIDAFPPDLLYASVTMCPTLGGTSTGHDKSKLTNSEGIYGIYPVDPYHGGTGGVAVIADNPFIAMRALCQMSFTWDHGPAKNTSDADILATLNKAIDEGTQQQTFYSTGHVEDALKAGRPLKMRYSAPYLAHAALEPINCTAQVKDDEATIWTSTQIPMAARKAVASFLKLDVDKVHVQPSLLGGGFGRRLEVDYIVQAVAIARHAKGRPVQTVWPRAQDMTHDFYRPACVSHFMGALDANGKLVAWKNESASQSISVEALPRAFGFPKFVVDKFKDTTSAEGAFDQAYECENMTVTHNTVSLPIPIGSWRSVGHSIHAFFVESFIDEMALAAHKDPFEFRLEMLTRSEHQRHAYVLKTLMEFSQWRQRPKDGITAKGLAMHEAFGSVVAQVAEVQKVANPPKGSPDFKVTRVYCVVDCGVAINPNLIEQQMESGIIFGLSAALEQKISIVNGQVQQKYFSDFPIVNMSNCPEIFTKVLQCGTEPQGVGEAGTPPIAPAVANALFALTGKRCRDLPLIEPQIPCAGDLWCQSISTGDPSSCMPPRIPLCSGHSAANPN